MTDPIRLNLGAGDNPIDGYDNSWDAKHGKQAYPLKVEDNSCDEILASHLLEHFGHRGAHIIVKEWVRALKPGGLLKIAVPDLERIANMYVRGEPGQYQGWLSGGQVDPLDNHLAQYDWVALTSLLRHCGLVGIHKWPGNPADCSGLPISLNVAGYKRPEAWPRVIGVMSSPRLGFVDQFGCALDALHPLGIPLYRRTGAFYGQCMTLAIEAAINDGAEYVLSLDYDSIFNRENLEDLLAFATHNALVDALVPVQVHRMKNVVMFRPTGQSEGTFRLDLPEWDVTYWPISMGHFGCTLIRTEAIVRMQAPWFHSKPDDENSWIGAHIDDDRWFWDRFVEAGNYAFLCPRVVIGHCENIILWPDRTLNRIYQHTDDWWESGKPRGVWR